MTLSYNGTTVTGVTFNGTVCSSVICNGTTVFTSGPTSLAMVNENVFPFSTTGVGTLYTVPSALTSGVSNTIFNSYSTLADKIIVRKSLSNALGVYNFDNAWGTALSGMTAVYCDDMMLNTAGNVLFTVNLTTLAVDAYDFSSSGIGTKYASSPTGTNRNSLYALPDGSGILLYQGLSSPKLKRIAWSSGWGTATILQDYEAVYAPLTTSPTCNVLFYSSMMYKLNATSLGTKYANPASGNITDSIGVCFNPAGSVFISTKSTYNPQYWQWNYTSGFGSASVINTTPAITYGESPIFSSSGSYLLFKGSGNTGYAFNWSGTAVGTALATGGPYNVNSGMVRICGTP